MTTQAKGRAQILKLDLNMEMLLDDTCGFINANIICRSAFEAQKAMSHDITCLYLDYDLGERPNGADFAKWMIEVGYKPEKVIIVSGSLEGRIKIANILRQNGYNNPDSETIFERVKP